MQYKRSSLIVRVELVHRIRTSDSAVTEVDSIERVKKQTSKRLTNEIRIVCSTTLNQKIRRCARLKSSFVLMRAQLFHKILLQLITLKQSSRLNSHDSLKKTRNLIGNLEFVRVRRITWQRLHQQLYSKKKKVRKQSKGYLNQL